MANFGKDLSEIEIISFEIFFFSRWQNKTLSFQKNVFQEVLIFYPKTQFSDQSKLKAFTDDKWKERKCGKILVDG